MNRNRNRNDYENYRNNYRPDARQRNWGNQDNWGNQGNWGGDQNAFQRNESAWNRGNVHSPGGWGQSWGANQGMGAPGSGYRGSDYQRENWERRNYPYSDYNRREDRMPYERQGRNFIERAGDTIRRGWNRAEEAIREGWDDITDRDDSDRSYDRGRMRNRPYESRNQRDYYDSGYNDLRERDFRRGSEYGGNYGGNRNDYREDAYRHNRDNDYYSNRYEEQNRYNQGRRWNDDQYNDEMSELGYNRSWDR